MSRRGLIDLRSSGAVWTPANLTGLIGWYKADAQVYKDAGVTPCSNNDTIQQWNDQSGNGINLTQGVVGARPTFLSAGYNSKQTVKFVAASSNALVSSVLSGLNGKSSASFFFVGQMFTGTSSNGTAMDYLASGNANDWDVTTSVRAICRNGASNAIFSYYNSSSEGTANVSLSTNYRIGIVFSSTGNTPYVNNVAGTSGSFTFGTLGNNGVFNIGGQASAQWDGLMSEIVITNTTLSGSDLNNLDSYFTNKWGT